MDVDGSVDRALDASRDGTMVSRAWRQATGGRVERDVTAKVTYSRRAVRRHTTPDPQGKAALAAFRASICPR